MPWVSCDVRFWYVEVWKLVLVTSQVKLPKYACIANIIFPYSI